MAMSGSNRILPRLVGGTITHLDWSPVDDESTEKALQLSVDTSDGTHIAVELRADLVAKPELNDDCDYTAPIRAVLGIFEKGEW